MSVEGAALGVDVAVGVAALSPCTVLFQSSKDKQLHLFRSEGLPQKEQGRAPAWSIAFRASGNTAGSKQRSAPSPPQSRVCPAAWLRGRVQRWPGLHLQRHLGLQLSHHVLPLSLQVSPSGPAALILLRDAIEAHRAPGTRDPAAPGLSSSGSPGSRAPPLLQLSATGTSLLLCSIPSLDGWLPPPP